MKTYSNAMLAFVQRLSNQYPFGDISAALGGAPYERETQGSAREIELVRAIGFSEQECALIRDELMSGLVAQAKELEEKRFRVAALYHRETRRNGVLIMENAELRTENSLLRKRLGLEADDVPPTPEDE